MVATIGRMTTVTSVTFLRHIARARDERKIQLCDVRIVIIKCIATKQLVIQRRMMVLKNIGQSQLNFVQEEKGKSHEYITRGFWHAMYLCIKILPRA